MLNKMTLHAGATPNSAPLEVDLTSMTVFVGPNNSGKSQALREIEAWLCNSKQPKGVVIKKIGFESWDEGEFESLLKDVTVEPELNEKHHFNDMIIEKFSIQSNKNTRIQIGRSIIDEVKNPNVNRTYYTRLMSLYTLKLDGTNRLALTNEVEAGDLLSPPKNLSMLLCQNKEIRDKLRKIIYEAFGKFLVIDPTNIGKIRFRLSSSYPSHERIEIGWDKASREFHSKATPISESSDGVKAFVGVLASIIGGDPKVTLLDEPEAFLHPALSSKLGKEITNEIAKSKKRVFVSTHSASFLMGCIQAGAEINIVRLTYNNEHATARILKKENLTPLMMKPLLRSVGVLNALFYKFVIVTESDADRSFYQEINERLVACNDERGIAGCLFLNAQNKQTVWEIVKPLRALGIPAAGIVDIDVLKEGGKVWEKPLSGASIPSDLHSGLCSDRGKILNIFNKLDGMDKKFEKMKRDGGIKLLNGEDKLACADLFERLESYGVFIVPYGELESWLANSDVDRKKSKWLFEIFNYLGDDPNSESYVKPTEGDVWDFIGRAGNWLKNENRKGIPE